MKGGTEKGLAPAPKCLDCGYELTGFNIGDICPECGTEIERLRPPNMIPEAAPVSIIAGLGSYVVFALAFCGLEPLILLCLVCSCIGMLLAFVSRSECRKHKRMYGRRARLLTRAGFWLNVPGVAITLFLLAVLIRSAFS